MGASGAPELSQDGDGTARTRGRLAFAPNGWRASAIHRRPPLLIGALVVCLAVTAIAAISYYGARTFTRRAADQRAAEEAASFAKHSSLLATGDAFNGYLQILSYADDPIMRDRIASPQARLVTMQRLLWLNTNRMTSLSIVDRSGLALATTDDTISSVRDSTAFNQARADLGPSSSDILVPVEGKPGYVEYAAPLHEADGSVWGFVYARAQPQTLWRNTLNATIDGGHNVIINSRGLFAAGVPDALLGQPWKGSPLGNGGVRASVASVDSICGLGAIGKDTQIDHGWFVASCLPASQIQVEAGRALGNQGQITIAAAVLALVLSIGLLRITLGSGPSEEPVAGIDETFDAPEDVVVEYVVDEITLEPAPALPEPTVTSEPPVPPPVEPSKTVVIADVDALTLIEAYERRNARLSQELRESVQARLMIAATQADEAYRLVADDPERADALHRAAIEEIESLRERELRGMGQELHPSLVRLGLRGALRSLQKEFEGRIALELAIDANVDGASGRGGRTTIDPRLRLVLYRLVRDAVRALLDAGVPEVRVSMERDGLEAVASISCGGSGFSFSVADALMASEVALQAFSGSLSIDVADRVSADNLSDGKLSIVARVIAPHVEQPEPEPELTMDDEDETAGAADSFESASPESIDASVGGDAETSSEPLIEEDAPTKLQPSPVLPAAATTFRLPDDAPIAVDASEGPEPADMESEAETPDGEELPAVIQIASLAELEPGHHEVDDAAAMRESEAGAGENAA